MIIIKIIIIMIKLQFNYINRLINVDEKLVLYLII